MGSRDKKEPLLQVSQKWVGTEHCCLIVAQVLFRFSMTVSQKRNSPWRFCKCSQHLPWRLMKVYVLLCRLFFIIICRKKKLDFSFRLQRVKAANSANLAGVN